MGINNIKDFYYILGLAKNASKDEIKKAYRKLSLKFHPDHNNGDKFFEERFRDVHEAYETLIDDIKRRWYDDKVSGFKGMDRSEKNYPYTYSFQGQPAKKQQGPKPVPGPPQWHSYTGATYENKLNKTIYPLIGIAIFLIPFIIKIVLNKLHNDDSFHNYNGLSQYQAPQSSSTDTAAPPMLTNTDTTSYNTPSHNYLASQPASTDTNISTTVSQKDNNLYIDFKDDDGLTATDALTFFLQSLNNNDCNAAWSMTYNSTWESYGKEWFCSSRAFGGVQKILIRNTHPVAQIIGEAVIYAEYYAGDVYNGNKCFKQNITLQKIAFTDKARWKMTKMKNVEPAVICNGYR
ncbi:MAG: J domain-containing protein [Ginsengibacter sp.]